MTTGIVATAPWREARRRLVRAACRLAHIIEMPESAYTLSDDYNRAFMNADEELREASLAFWRSLRKVDRERLADAAV